MNIKLLVWCLCLVALFVCLCGCGGHESRAPAKTESSSERSSPQADDEDRSELNTTEKDAEEGEESRIADEESSEEDSSDNYFHGYRCTDDCSGHQAGYAWAEEQDIRDPTTAVATHSLSSKAAARGRKKTLKSNLAEYFTHPWN